MGMFDPPGYRPPPPPPGEGPHGYGQVPIRGWELWQPQGPGPRQAGYVYGMPPQPNGDYWTNQYNWQAPAMYRPNAENGWTVFGRPDQYPWPAVNGLGSGVYDNDPNAMAQAFLSAYGLGNRQTALTRFTRQAFPGLQDQYHVWAAQHLDNPLTFGQWVQDNAAQLLDQQFRDATAAQQGRQPQNFVGRVRAVGGGGAGI